MNWADIEVAWDAEELNLVSGLFLTENDLELIKVQLFQCLSRLREYGHHLEGSQARDPVSYVPAPWGKQEKATLLPPSHTDSYFESTHVNLQDHPGDHYQKWSRVGAAMWEQVPEPA